MPQRPANRPSLQRVWEAVGAGANPACDVYWWPLRTGTVRGPFPPTKILFAFRKIAYPILVKSSCLLAAVSVALQTFLHTAPAQSFLPGARVLLDAHNCYPYEGLWADRMDRALSTGVPLAIEVDLIWDATTKLGNPQVVVRHGGKATGDEPTLEDYFFKKVRPIVEKALQDANHSQWPLVTLNINDLRASEPEFFAALWKLMGTYESWLCTAPKTADIARQSTLDVKPVLVLTCDGTRPAKVFYDDVAVGSRLRMFAAGKPDRNGDNFRRWVNYPWSAVEPEGQTQAADWTNDDAARLKSLVANAHQRGYWIRFYTLNGHGTLDTALRGWTPSYNFGSLEAVTLRWKAAQSAGVDFVASDQYEECAKALRHKSAPSGDAGGSK